ncbi:MAG: hypothetical protein A3J30_04225 [Candidatus Wildermuthbacteria bacterium RIFCSPLOWO2_02_FULL_47_9c]|uniref:Uncharacterized protein n=2 Tax=Parcubacteria group TaxID=1794811 RepID=A0A837ISK3_9BACT|nr:MAG: hypothetical protein UY25_C0002G0080 [Candidatus Yanofskybacteria bacterium GW2011_GWC1_48_11]KKW04672.1 MAG: hypothetical protein UY38_C0001G0239 [Parcubacteria group bacterium GW2011_GWB1_49_12]KKW09028.1 MAG: hypothetical protein UY45_C0002G0080 [Parcubacteria group bacterium GW2011_GWA1_49_26]KKW13469.1 MAG: hypothetical protein UY53_C0013G0011 [Parcubacteria group bacterium GW2011_GWA2_50_10]OHA61078.1 MAG: hypothetical protein A2109_02390 [Candidatus Wildermuthbacteria bacterium G
MVKGSYRIIEGPAAGDFAPLIIREVPFTLTIQDGSSKPSNVSCTLHVVEKLGITRRGGIHKLKLTGSIGGSSYAAFYDPSEHSGNITIL